MSHPVIRVEALSKQYVLGGEVDQGQTLRELITGAFTRPFSRLRRLQGRSEQQEKFWALKDLTFEVARGDVVGIIGANGAGKTTLLKILSRITPPTSGAVHYQGRIASLLEIGTGFHPELSGRENIYINGAILGMTRSEIHQRFDDIVDFSGVHKFLDTPVKRFSSGMYVRLAFAVAAHMDPDILIVDEVLAVGDAEFQNRCLRRMQSISEHEGKTVLFVSHNLDAIQRICRDAIYLKEGRIEYHGSVGPAIEHYLSRGIKARDQTDMSAIKERWGTGEVRIAGLDVLDQTGMPVNVLHAGEKYQFVLSYRKNHDVAPLSNVIASLALKDVKGMTVLLVSSDFINTYFDITDQSGQILCEIAELNLTPGDYTITLFLGQKGGETLDCLNDVARITVAGGDYFGTGHPGLPEHCRTLSHAAWSMSE